jgi:hypothetical protein
MGSLSMTTVCHLFPRSLAEELLQIVARAICDRPGENAPQRESRTHQMVQSTMGFEPRDGLEYMLATLAVGHFHLLLDSMHDAFQGQVDQLKAKTKTTIVALDRVMLEMIRELRMVRRRPTARSAEDTQYGAADQYGAAAAAPSPRPMPAPPNNEELPWAEVPLPTPASPPECPGVAAVPEAATPSDPHQPDPRQPDPRQPDIGAATSEPAVSRTRETSAAEMTSAESGPARLVPRAAGEPVLDTGKFGPRPAVSANGEASSRVTSHADLPEWTDADEAALKLRLAANEVVLAAMKEEARQYDSAKAAAAGSD